MVYLGPVVLFLMFLKWLASLFTLQLTNFDVSFPLTLIGFNRLTKNKNIHKLH